VLLLYFDEMLLCLAGVTWGGEFWMLEVSMGLNEPFSIELFKNYMRTH